MVVSESTHHKYIKVCEGSVRVKIERGSDVHLKHFPIRNYPGLSHAIDAAIAWRDEKHLHEYGIPVTDKVIQIKQRDKTHVPLNPQTAEKLPDLSAGISYGFHRGKLLYVVASYQVEGKPKRKRFSIIEHGLESAISLATQYRLATLKKDG
jgi:hypothetical protein